MRIEFPYDAQKIEIEIPDKNLIGVFSPNKVEIKNETYLLNKSLQRFKKFTNNAKNILFIVNDATRSTPTAKILDIIYEYIKNKEIKFLIATGIHKKPTPEELGFIFKKYYDKFKNCIEIHDSKRKENMRYIGTTSRKTPVWINSLIFDFHKIVCINSVEPHYFAGYTGGRKSFVPGIAGYQTIEQNHIHAINPNSKPLMLRGNPVHEDMMEAFSLIKNKTIFSIQLVLDKEENIYFASSGDIISSFNQAVLYAQKVFCVKISEKADIVVTIVYPPLDVNLFQSHKAIEHAKLALKKGGILILVSPCREGIGHREWFDFISECNLPEKVIDKAKNTSILGTHKAVKLSEAALMGEVWGVTRLKEEDMKKIFIRPFQDVQQAINLALERKGKGAKILFLMDGALTVPICKR